VNSHLLEGKVRHRRSRPTVYEFEHDVYYFALDLDELDEVASRLRLVSRNRRNVYSFRDSDHLLPQADDLRAAVWDHLRAEGFDPDGWRATLVTSLRVFGYVFNPASFYLCRNRAGELEVVIVEVHNTYHERHLYTLRPAVTPAAHVASMDKGFYVSPFIDTDASYTVRVQDRPDSLRIVIDETEHGTPLLQASMVLRRRPLGDRNLLRLFLRHPLVTHKTIGMIHVHALRLWLKGVRFHRHGQATR
jgi:uncharacterized protein